MDGINILSEDDFYKFILVESYDVILWVEVARIVIYDKIS